MQRSLQISRNLQGILCLLIALVFLTGSDAIIKWLSPRYPLHELTLVKALVALLVVLIFVRFFGGLAQLKTRRPFLHLLRGFTLVLSDALYFLGLATMPMATNVILFFCAPFFVCIMARLYLGESVGLPRWMAIATGLAGVMVIAQPGSLEFTWNVIFPVLSAMTYALMIMMTKKLSLSDSAGAMSVYIFISFIAVSLLAGALAGDGRFDLYEPMAAEFLFRAWQWPSFATYQLLLICGLASAVGLYLLSHSYRIAKSSAVVPFEYASLPLTIAAGFLIWGDLPNLRDYIGSMLIIVSGLVIVHFEVHACRKNR